MSKNISAELSDRIAHQLDIVSKNTHKSESYHIQRAIKKYLLDYRDLTIAYKRQNDKDDPVISISEMRSNLGINFSITN
jgi:predicted DNA-binding protein